MTQDKTGGPACSVTMEVGLLPYSDGSGYACTVEIDSGGSVSISQGANTVTFNADEWPLIQTAITEMVYARTIVAHRIAARQKEGQDT